MKPFDKEYYESETYAGGKETVAEGLRKGLFAKKDDGAVFVDLSDKHLLL